MLDGHGTGIGNARQTVRATSNDGFWVKEAKTQWALNISVDPRTLEYGCHNEVVQAHAYSWRLLRSAQ